MGQQNGEEIVEIEPVRNIPVGRLKRVMGRQGACPQKGQTMKKLMLLVCWLFLNWQDTAAQDVSLRYSQELVAPFRQGSAAVLNEKKHLLTEFALDAQPQARQSETLRPATFPALYDCSKLAFFCRVEVKLEKAASFPVKFRLGDVQYVERLEGKH